MEKLAPVADGSARDQREELEQVQMELRAARLSAQSAAEDTAVEQASLEAALAAATVKRDAAAARLTALTEERNRVKRRVEELGPRLDTHEEEQAVLARGAALRDKYVDWNPPDGRRFDVRGVAIVAVFLVIITILLFAR